MCRPIPHNTQSFQEKLHHGRGFGALSRPPSPGAGAAAPRPSAVPAAAALHPPGRGGGGGPGPPFAPFCSFLLLWVREGRNNGTHCVPLSQARLLFVPVPPYAEERRALFSPSLYNRVEAKFIGLPPTAHGMKHPALQSSLHSSHGQPLSYWCTLNFCFSSSK